MVSGLTAAQATPKPAASGSESSYARSATVQHLLHWKRMPVSVYFIPGPALTQKRQEQARAGFDEWVQASGGVVSYTVVDSPVQADISVTLETNATVPGQHGAAGNTAIFYARDRMTSAQIEIATGRTTANQLQEVAAHEFGHALGIDGHSDNPTDLMAPVEMRLYDSYGFPIDAPAHAVTARDLNTLKACYGLSFADPARPQLAALGADRDSETVNPTAPPH